MQETLKKYMVFKVNYGSDDSKRFLYEKHNGQKSELIPPDRYKKSMPTAKILSYRDLIPYIIRYFASYYLNS